MWKFEEIRMKISSAKGEKKGNLLQWKIHTNRYGTFGREKRNPRVLLKRILEWFFLCISCLVCASLLVIVVVAVKIGKVRDYV